MANQYTNIAPEQRFWANVPVGMANQCWEWKGTRDKDGYGKLSIGGRGIARGFRAHRLAYTLHYGPIPPGYCVLHKCDNPPCVNPDHLRLGTQADNRAETVTKGRQPRGDNHWMKKRPQDIRRGDDSFSRKHPERVARGERCRHSKLTDRIVRMARKRFSAGGVTIRELAKEYGVTKDVMARAIKKQTWRHVG